MTASTGLKGSAVVATIEAYRAAFNYVVDGYYYIDSKLNNMIFWYNCYNLGY